MEPDPRDVAALRIEKYGGDASADMSADLARLSRGEPLAYVIGHIPFMGLSINLESHPLIPRPETEWWTEELVKHIGERPLHVLDLCAGSGAIGAAVLKHCPEATVSFGELMEEHIATIMKNVRDNGIDLARADIRQGDLFAPFTGETFDLIATNPPYIPTSRTLPPEVADYEPYEALLAEEDGLGVIRRLIEAAPHYLSPHGELWIECDIANIEEAERLAKMADAKRTLIRTDQYDRPRLLVSYW